MSRSSALLEAIRLPAKFRLRRVLDGFLHLLTRTDTTMVEFIASTSLLVIGVILAMPEKALDKAPLFVTMRALAPEWAWAAACLTLGAFQSIANLSRHQEARRGAAFAAFVFFGFIGLLGASVHPISLFGALCKVQALGQVLVYWQLGVHGVNGEK